MLGLAVIALAAGGRVRAPPAPGAPTRSTTSTSPRGGSSGSPRCAGIIVFGSLMGAMFIGQQFLQNVLGYSTLEAGAAILPGRGASWCSSRPARPSWSRPAARASPCSSATSFVLLGFLTMLLLWDEGSRYWQVGLGYAFVGIGRRVRRHAGLALADRFGPGHAGPAWRRGPPTCSATWAARSCSRSSAPCSPPATRRPSRRRSAARPTRQGHRQTCRPSSPSRSPARRPSPQQYPQYASQITAAAKPSFLDGDQLGLHGRHRRGPARRAAGLLHVPEARTRSAAARRVPRGGRRAAGGGVGDKAHPQ